jgi:hypothetical protein
MPSTPASSRRRLVTTGTPERPSSTRPPDVPYSTYFVDTPEQINVVKVADYTRETAPTGIKFIKVTDISRESWKSGIGGLTEPQTQISPNSMLRYL